MERSLVFCLAFTILNTCFPECAGFSTAQLQRGLVKFETNIMKRTDPARMLSTGSAVTSVYVGGTGIWWRSGIIASVSQMEQGKKEESMETLNIAIATLAVFDTTQATVAPLASELIDQLVKHKGMFPNTLRAFSNVNTRLTTDLIEGGVGAAEDVIDNSKRWRNTLAQSFDTEVTNFMKNTQGYDDLVKSLQNAKTWAKGLKWLDTMSGPFLDAANIAFCGWQLHNAIHDEDSASEVRSLNIASASIGVACGVVGVTAFAVGALATAGTALATFAGPVGVIIGCILSLTAIIIDVINNHNPYGDIKDHLDTIQQLKEGSLSYLKNQVDITNKVNRMFKGNTGFHTIYEINQGNLIQGMRSHAYRSISGVDDDPNLKFDAKASTGHEDGHLTKGKLRTFDKSKYSNMIFKPRGIVPLGYDFYGKTTNNNGHGITVIANTAMVGQHFWIRGVHIDTRVENDEQLKNPDNVVIGETTGLSESDHLIRVWTGAGDDLLQVTGLPCNGWTYHQNCLWAVLGSGINTLSFQGMNPERVSFPFGIRSHSTKIFVGIKYNMRDTRSKRDDSLPHEIFLKMKNTPSASGITNYKIGYVTHVAVFHGSPKDDVVVMGDQKNCIVKQDAGRNKYFVFVSGKRDFTHTIIDDSETPGQVYLIRDDMNNLDLNDIVYDAETQTLVIFMRQHQIREWTPHQFTGKIIFKRTKNSRVEDITITKVRSEIPRDQCDFSNWDDPPLNCLLDLKLGSAEIKREMDLTRRSKSYYGRKRDWPVPGVPFYYYMGRTMEVSEINGICGDFIIKLNPIKDDMNNDERRVVSLNMPTNSIIALDDSLIEGMKSYNNAYFVLFYLRETKKLVWERRFGELTEARYTVEVRKIDAKRIVYGTVGSQQLLLDLEHDDRSEVNLGSEYIALSGRQEDYRFDGDYNNDETASSTKPKHVVLGVPRETASRRRWKIELGSAATSAGEGTTGNYAENALIVTNTLWTHLSRERNDIRVYFRPIINRPNKWAIVVRKGSNIMHRVVVSGVNTLAYHQGLVRTNLYDLKNGERKQFNLFRVWKTKMDPLDDEVINEANSCR